MTNNNISISIYSGLIGWYTAADRNYEGVAYLHDVLAAIDNAGSWDEDVQVDGLNDPVMAADLVLSAAENFELDHHEFENFDDLIEEIERKANLEAINDALEELPNTTTSRSADGRWFVTFDEPIGTSKQLTAELSVSRLCKEQVKVYGKDRFHVGQEVLWLNTYSHEEDGTFGFYNPTDYTVLRHYANGQKYGSTINFDWLLDATPENALKLLGEVKAMAETHMIGLVGPDEDFTNYYM